MKFINKFPFKGLLHFGCGPTMHSQKTLAIGIGRLIPHGLSDDYYFTIMACFVFCWANFGIRVKRGEHHA